MKSQRRLQTSTIGAATNDETITKHESVIVQLQTDLTAKTSRLEGAITGADAATQTSSSNPTSRDGGRKRVPLDENKN